MVRKNIYRLHKETKGLLDSWDLKTLRLYMKLFLEDYIFPSIWWTFIQLFDMDTGLSLETKNWRKAATFQSYLFSRWLVQQLSPVLLYFDKKI